MRFQVLSDLHLESSNMPFPKVEGVDAIFVVGDLCVDVEYGFDFLSRADVPVVFVPGNHEFEGQEYYARKEQLYRLGEQFGIQVLQGNIVQLGDVHVLGATLWSGFRLFPGEEAWAKKAAQDLVHEFSVTRIMERGCDVLFSPDRMQVIHDGELAWLESALNELKREKTVVLTHFPLFKGSLADRYAHDMVSAYFVNDYQDKLGGMADVFCHGHTHTSFDYDVFGSRVLCNPRGNSKLFGLSSNPEFKSDLVIDL